MPFELKKICWVVTFCFLIWRPTLLIAQSGSANVQDSLIKKLLDKANESEHNEPDSAIFFAKKALELALTGKRHEYEAEAYFEIGRGHMGKGEWNLAHQVFLKSKEGYQSLGDSLKLADVYNQMGYTHQALRQYDQAFSCLLTALRLRKKFDADPKLIASSEGGIGFLYQNTDELEKAEEHHLRALEIRETMPNPPSLGIGFSLKNLGVVYFKKKEYETALKYLNSALDTFYSENKKPFIRTAHTLIGEVLLEQKKFSEAEIHFKKALEIAEEVAGVGIKARIYSRFGQLYYETERHEKAIRFLKNASELAEKSGDRKTLSESVYRTLANALFEWGATEEAFYYALRHGDLKDSLYSEDIAKQMAFLKTEYETDLIETENKNLLQQKLQRERERIFLIGGMGLVLMLLFLIFRENRIRKQAFNNLLGEKDKTDKLLGEKEQLLSDLKETQLQLIQSEKMASLGLLTAGIAHEINNPINFISTNVQALKLDFQDVNQLLEKVKNLQNGTTPEEISALEKALEIDFIKDEIQQLLDGIENGVDRTQSIISGLRTFSRSTGENFTERDLIEGLDATLTILNSKLLHRINVHKNYEDLPLVSCQFEKLNQVFMNILSNAIDAIEDEGEIFISAQHLQKSNEVKISIRDTGKGMDEKTKQRIFEPFFTTKEIGKGTGLGMAISYGIIEKHNGNIEIESKEGTGTTFIITLPVKPDKS